jgi:hypothetical protein
MGCSERLRLVEGGEVRFRHGFEAQLAGPTREARFFNLRVHFETKDVPVFALILVKAGTLGPKLLPHEQGPPCPDSYTRSSAPPSDGSPPKEVFPPNCDTHEARARNGSYQAGAETACHLVPSPLCRNAIRRVSEIGPLVLPPFTPMLVIFALAFLAHDTLPHDFSVAPRLIPARPRRMTPRAGDS